MAFVHGHARETGWVVSHYRRPQRAGDDQLDLELPAPRREDHDRPGDDRPGDDQPGDEGDDEPDPASVRSIPRRTASTR